MCDQMMNEGGLFLDQGDGKEGVLHTKPDFTTTLVVMKAALILFVLQACLHATSAHVGPCPCCQLNAKDADMENVLLSSDITTTKMLVK